MQSQFTHFAMGQPQNAFFVSVYDSRKSQITNELDDFKEIKILRIHVAWLWKTLSSCSSFYQQWRNKLENPILPLIYVITPTYARPTQKAELVRLSHTLMLVPKLHWILVEDSNQRSALVNELLIQSGLSYTHLHALTSSKYKLKNNDPNWLKPRGVFQRNAALEWLRKQEFQVKVERVVYFADDDNTYDLQLFEEMRYTSRVSAWPVGLVGGLQWESPQVESGKITGWIVAWEPERPFAIDMAGFAINLRLILENPEAQFSPDVPRGYIESSLLQTITTIQDIEPKAENCTKIYVWHTRTEKVKFLSEKKLQFFNQKSQLIPEMKV